MIQKAVNNYYKFFDETLESTTFIVLLITSIIFIVGTIMPTANADYMKGNILESSQKQAYQNVVVIDGVEYEISFSRTEK